MDYLDKLEKQANKMFARVEGWEINALKRVGRRVKNIRHLSYADLQAINNAAISKQDVNAVLEELAEITGQNVRDVKAAYDEMIAEQHEINRHLYDYRGKPFVSFKDNKALQAITRAYARTTAETFVNLSMTSAKRIGFVDDIGKFKPLDVAFTEVIDKAVMSVTTGTGDFNSEMLDVLRQLGGSGVRVDYGHGITRHLDSMVRQNMLWGAKQAYREYDRVIGEELGCDGVEIDWHNHPRPSHIFMQGKQYCLGPSRTINGTKFIGFEEKDPTSEEGKSASEALNDWGCLHFETSIICGVSEPTYSAEELERLNEQNNRPIETDGVTKTGYEWKQSMRRLERGGKQAKMQRELFKSEGNLPEARKWDERLKMIEDKYQLVADRTGMKAQYEKMAVIKAKALDNGNKSGIISNMGTTRDANTTQQNKIPLSIPQIPSSTIGRKITAGEYSTALSHQQYNKHVDGTSQYNEYLLRRKEKGGNPQSILTITEEEAQQIILSKAGTGIVKADRKGTAKPQEKITCDKIIGKYYGGGQYHVTNKAVIHYGKKNAHIVPIKGDDYD